jgi:hypothetical protein
MIKHVVMWRLHENNQENRSEISCLLSGLPDIIDDLVSPEVGSNFSLSEFAYDLVLITTHGDKAALERYKEHPEHILVANRIKELTRERVVVDFEYYKDA